MRHKIFAHIVAATFGIVSVLAGASEDRRGDSRTEDTAASGPEPTPAELAEATYTGIEDQGPITLSGGKWEGKPWSEGGASVPALWLSERFYLTGDLDRDGADEAVAHLTYNSGGTGNFGYLAVIGREGGEIVQKAIGLVGDRVQIRAMRIDGGSVVLDVLQAGPGDGMCCPSQLATRTFGIQNEKLVETASAVTGTASVSTLERKEWTLRAVDGDRAAKNTTGATLVFDSGKISGSTGCNRYQGSVRQGESATSLLIGPLTSTRMACPEPIAGLERAYLELLQSANVFQFQLGELVLSGAKGKLTFSVAGD